VLDWVRDGTLALRIGHEFPLSAAAEAHRQLQARATTGKVQLIPEPHPGDEQSPRPGGRP
jgi:NADPH2:quinone reductase